jgi:predicted Zn-dependent peptidase
VSAALALLAGPARAQQVKVEEFTLDNGMKFLLYPRTEQPNIIAAGWIAKVGSVNERPGITGISHFFEHMMFKGTNTIGTKDPKKDAEFRVRQQAVKDKLMKLTLDEQYKRFRAGEIDDPWDPANDTQEMAVLRGELKQLMDDHKAAIVNNEFDKVYTELGASGMNAFTSNDITFYFINVPSTKLELWAWMESDRLNDSVFREFYAERDVVHEERRLRTESTPTGVFQEQFDAMFWQSSPYSWPVIGWTSDLNSYTMEQARDYFDIYYRPNNLVGVIVGDFDPAEAKAVISRYFGRLSPGTVQPPPVVTLEMKQMAEKRMNAECDCQPQIEIRYHTVPFGHQDTWALNMMAELLNGRTGRLYKSMIEGAEIASSARASGGSPFEPAKYAGYFSFTAETKGNAAPEQLEEAWYKELARLQTEAVPDRELQKVKNQSAADAYRALQNNFFILVQLGIYENLGGWEWINTAPRELQKVTAEDIKRVANTYFGKDNRSVGIYRRKAGLAAEESDPEFEALKEKIGPQMAAMAKKNVEQIRKATDMAKLRDTIAGMEEAKSSGQVPPQMAPMLDFLMNAVRERIAELEKAESAKGAE